MAAGYERQDHRIWKALEQADAADLVRNMENGLDTWLYKSVEDGVEISGGEAQKLALARALYKDAPVVILDEPTAALDPKAEAEVYERFGQLVEGRTSIYISHRMSSCRFCDEIIVFQDGQIVEQGSHEELFAAGGCYAQMWNAQAKYYA
ncbi:ABC transporter ATP-binding protein [uncultured Acetatifactor sp.]|uniref:ATP-binding cassette domain-containing protein n=1 Tax=uncultured Acetatifactor sp. TaxID=1671927 RepID=UPI002617AEB0|nr:ABC transporter ATP-binding protein [uncultured Acetatifactor sp.]